MEPPFSLLKPHRQVRVALVTKEHHIAEKELAARMRADGLVALRQEHGARTVIMRSASDRMERADGVITDAPKLLLTIRAADCQNFVIVAPEKNVIGVLHAGWRGLVRGAIPEFFATLKKEFPEIDSAELIVCAGPSLCTVCAGFTDPSTELANIDSRFFRDTHVNLRGIADQQFLDAGILPEHLERHSACTRCHPERFWTYRGGDKEDVIAGKTNLLGAMIV